MRTLEADVKEARESLPLEYEIPAWLYADTDSEGK